MLVLWASAAITGPPAAQRVLKRATWLIWLQAAPIVATLNAIRGRWDVWQHAPPAEPSASLTVA